MSQTPVSDLSPDLSRLEPAIQQALERAREVVVDLEGSASPEPLAAQRLALLSPGERQQRAESWGTLAAFYHVQELTSAAKAAYLRASLYAPESSRWPYLLGLLHLGLGEPEAAADAFESSLANEDSALTQLRLADALLQIGRIDEAQQHYEAVRQADAMNAAALFGLGRIALAQRQFSLAASLFERVLALEPRASVVHYPLAQAYQRLGEAEKARAQLALRGETAIPIDDPWARQLADIRATTALQVVESRAARDDFDAVAFRGFVVSQLVNASGVIPYLESRLREGLEPGLAARLHFAAGCLLVAREEARAARHHFEEAVSLAPELSEARLALQRLLRRPSVLLVTLDTTRADVLAPYGGQVAKTPTLSRLAETGVLFENATAVAPLTLPTHASLLTGLYPYHHRARNNGSFSVDEDLTTLAEQLGEAGYRTAAFVAAAVLERRYGLAQGFELYDDDLSGGRPKELRMVAERPAAAVVEATRRWLDQVPEDAPFLAWVHLFDPHAAYEPPPPFDSEFRDDPYAGEISYVDAQLARLLAHPRLAGDEPVWIVVVGDHGEALGEHGEATHGLLAYQSTLHVPWIVRGPSAVAGRRVDSPVSQVDLMPTLLALLDLPGSAAAGLDGEDLSRLIRAPRAGDEFLERLADRVIYAEALLPRFLYGWAELRVVRRGTLKLIEGRKPELYRLDRDPNEKSDLMAREPRSSAVLRDQLAQLVADEQPSSPAEADADAETVARLAALGYVTTSGTGQRSIRPNPVELIDLHETLGQAKHHLLLRDPESAIGKLESVLERDPENLEALRLRATAAVDGGDLDTGETVLRRALALAPDDSELQLLEARLLSSRGDETAALRLLEQAASRSPEALDLEVERARLLKKAGEWDAAKTVLDRILLQAPNEPRFEVAYAELVDMPSRDWPTAAARLERAVEAEPFLARGWALLGGVLERQGRRDEALVAYDSGLERQPRDLELHARLGRLLVRQGEAAAAAEKLARAIRSTVTPPPSLLAVYGDALRQQGRAAAADDAYRQVVAAGEGKPPSEERARALFNLGRLDDAEAEWQSLLSQRPDDPQALAGLAGLAVRRGEWQRGEELARRAIGGEPQLSTAFGHLAICLEEQGQAEAALEAYERALELEPHSWETRFNYGLLLRRLSRFEPARQAFEEVLADNPRHAKSHYELGVLLGAFGDATSSRSHLERALELEPDHPRSARIRELLQHLP